MIKGVGKTYAENAGRFLVNKSKPKMQRAAKLALPATTLMSLGLAGRAKLPSKNAFFTSGSSGDGDSTCLTYDCPMFLCNPYP